ncbi:MAG: S1/P1 nuclease [Proteobacteria bacterium]|nr:S1/P1 nuclease [Pseudomonadota bacterium]
MKTESNIQLLKSPIKVILLLGVLFVSNTSQAWNAAGHHLMAAITWDLMSTQQQDYWVDILEHHPRFKKDFKGNVPKYVKRNPQSYKEWVFRKASTWPDIARGIPKKQRDKYHHSTWHYINYPLYLDKNINTKFLNKSNKWKGKFHNNLNIIQALKGNLEVLSKQGSTKKEKALALSWVLHLVSDAHQPLHSTALFSKKYFRKGDRGGNSIEISGQGHITNLHWYWDSRLDTTTSFRIIELKAKKLSIEYSNLSTGNKSQPIKQWAKESNKIAKKYVYTPKILNLLNTHEQQNKSQPTVFISNEYDKQAKKIAQQQIVNAGYKLAEILNNISN